MLRSTFIHIRGVGNITERRIWNGGVRTWDDFVKKGDGLNLPARRKEYIFENVAESLRELKAGNHGYFVRGLPKKETWRAYREFESSTVFLDIETTGLGFEHHDITVIGLFDGKHVNTYIKGINLDDFQFELSKYNMVVTFNGSLFDLPFIEAKYPNVKLDLLHVDLRFPLKRLGYSGGLKSIEKQLKITRDDDVKDMRGIDAVRLWKQYLRGNDDALHQLIKYNSEDIKNLKFLMEMAYKKLKARTLMH
ncbi:MAG: ribonuclease H-like domain-containing protein [Thermoplasmata archaeon]|nr:ribonuclease H-like domain-containing protein [Thermoplasmata archaeon]